MTGSMIDLILSYIRIQNSYLISSLGDRVDGGTDK